MIKISIKKQDQITNQAQFSSQEEAEQWLSRHQEMGSFGEPDSYEVISEDISAQIEQEKINAEALAFLAATDYVVIKAMEKGIELSPEFKAERQAARDRIVK